MAEKRKRAADAGTGDGAPNTKKVKKGFVVGPDNLPDGAYKRKSMPPLAAEYTCTFAKTQQIRRSKLHSSNEHRLRRTMQSSSDKARFQTNLNNLQT